MTSWKSATAALMALTITTGVAAPTLIATAPAAAQYYEYPTTPVTLASGTRIAVRYDKATKIVVTPTETAPVTLSVASNVKSSSGAIVIPVGTQVVGQLRPAPNGKGSRFVAQELVFSNGKRERINGASKIITRTQQVGQGSNTSSIFKGAALGGAAAAAIAALTGDKALATEEILGGAGLGALGGLFLGQRKVDVVVIDPNTDLNVTLRSPVALR